MARGLITAALLALALAPAAYGQEVDDPGPVTTPTPGCERGPGTDADYAYCPDRDCLDEGTDADYLYADCLAASGPPRAPRRKKAVSAVQPLAAQSLPVTGGEPLAVALFGAGFLLAGAGLRLRWSASPHS